MKFQSLGRGRSEALARAFVRLDHFRLARLKDGWPGTATPERCKEDTKNKQRFKGTFSDAICNGVHVTPLHRASENGRLKVVLVLLAQGVVGVHSRGKPNKVLSLCVPQSGHLEVGNI